MFIRKRKPFDPVGGQETPEAVFRASPISRRKWIRRTGLTIAGAGVLAAGGYWGWRQWTGADDDVIQAGKVDTKTLKKLAEFFPARLDRRFQYDRPQTERTEAARYTNFYEFSRFKRVWRYVRSFEPYPWTLNVAGLCRRPIKLDMEEFHRRFAKDLVERQYRHRCVERWAMAVPWTGIPLATILQQADPLPEAKYVRFTSFYRPQIAANQRDESFVWPYGEGLTLAEAMNDLTLLTVGVYGQPLLKQHGAPVRLVVPWKYGFKSIKSVERIEFAAKQPATFWTTANPRAYPFESNVDPDIPRPWSQSIETMLGTGERRPTQKYNGYGEWVAALYEST